jgi:hypothetical protein
VPLVVPANMKAESTPETFLCYHVSGCDIDMIARWLESTATFRKCTALKVSFVFLCILDFALTVLAVNIGLNELNPFIRFMFDMPVLLVGVKFAIPLLIAWLIPGRFLLPSIALLSLVAIWNVKELALFLV